MARVPSDTPVVKRTLRRLAAAVVAAAAAATVLPLTAGPASGAPIRVSVARTSDVDTNFTLMSFNVLGSSHTAQNGRHARMASGPQRIEWAIDYLDKYDVDVVGMQELQIDQYDAFKRYANGRYAIQHAGYTRKGTQNSIAWDTDDWSLVQAYTVKIPYFFGEMWDMPYVLLRNVHSGQEAYFANFHNPATNRRHPGSLKWRVEATRRQAALANRLLEETRRPVFITGDMNEREEYFCRLTNLAPMKAANGGGSSDGRCVPPPAPMPVNWIFGARTGGAFSDYVRDISDQLNRITDHIVPRAEVTIRSARTARR